LKLFDRHFYRALTVDTKRAAKLLYDALIVGGGAAGLSAALVLGRARRSVVVIDDARPRNAVVDSSHGFITRDGASPADWLRIARSELAAYPTVRFLNDAATSASKRDEQFIVSVASGDVLSGKRLLMATGVFDRLPAIDGLGERWGKSVFVCPFCDGWEVQHQRVAVHGKRRDAVELAQEIHGWTQDIIVCVETDDLTERDRRWIDASHALLKVGNLASLGGSRPSPITLTFEDAAELECQALFISTPLRQHSPLFAALGCKIGTDGLVVADSHSETTVTGCYAAGDAVAKHHQVIIAAASGASAAITISCNLLEAEAAELARERQA
jgi:thioredoxin reductase